MASADAPARAGMAAAAAMRGVPILLRPPRPPPRPPAPAPAADCTDHYYLGDDPAAAAAAVGFGTNAAPAATFGPLRENDIDALVERMPSMLPFIPARQQLEDTNFVNPSFDCPAHGPGRRRRRRRR